MFYWFYEFRNGRTCFEDEKRTSGPSAAVTPENVAAVELMVREDCRITNDTLQKTVGIGSAAVNTILHEHLSVCKRCARWVPHDLSEEQKGGMNELVYLYGLKFNSGTSSRLEHPHW